MKKRKRTCGNICHNAKGTRCLCICGGYYHGKKGLAHRETLAEMPEDQAKKALKRHGVVNGKTAYIDQLQLSLVEAGSR